MKKMKRPFLPYRTGDKNLVFPKGKFVASCLSYYTFHNFLFPNSIIADLVWDVDFLQDAVNELRMQVRDLQWELGVVRERMLREI
ncbi:hypothetical protein P3L10_031096 [Capsicum annuum]